MKHFLKCTLSLALLNLTLSGQVYADWNPFQGGQSVAKNPILDQGMVYENQKQWDKAADLYLNYLKEHPTRVDLLDRVAMIQGTYLNNPTAAANTYTKITELQPQNAQAFYSLSLLWQNAGNPKASLEALDKAIQLNPDNMTYYEYRLSLTYWLNLYGELKKTYTYVLSKEPQNPSALLAKANYYTYTGQWPEAIEPLQTYLKLRPDDLDAVEQYIKTLTSATKSQEATKVLEAHSAAFSKDKYAELQTWIEKNYKLAILANNSKFSWMNKEAQQYGLERSFTIQNLPDSGLDAEDQKKEKEAIAHYSQFVKQHPDVWEAWLRLAILYATQKNDKASADALAHVSPFFPNNVKLLQSIALQYTYAKQYSKALPYQDKALALDPNNLTYLKNKADILIEMKNYKGAYLVYQKILALSPNDIKSLLSMADALTVLQQYQFAFQTYNKVLELQPRNKTALLGIIDLYLIQNSYEKTLKAIDYYLQFYPKDKSQRILAANIKTWQEAYGQSYKLLQNYKNTFGPDLNYQRTTAYLYSLAGRPDLSNEILAPLLAKHPNDYDLMQTKTYADNNSGHILEALMDLEKVNQLKPNIPDTQRLNAEILTPLRSNIGADGYFFRGSDSIRIARGGLNGVYFLSPLTQLSAGVSEENVQAAPDSGLTPIYGGTGVNFVNYWVGATHQFSPKYALTGRLGNNQIINQNNNLNYQAAALFRLNDYVSGSIESTRTVYDTSPLTLSLGINQNLYGLNLNLRPGLDTYIELKGQYLTYTDGNSEWLGKIYPHKTVWVYEKLKLDLGIETYLYGYAEQLNNGYYDPSFYQIYSAVGVLNYRPNANTNYVLRGAAGPQKDETFQNYALGWDVAGQAEYGIYQDWYLSLTASYSNQLGGAATVGTPADGYHCYDFSARLVRRF